MKEKIEKSIEVLRIATKISADFYGKPLIIVYNGGKDRIIK